MNKLILLLACAFMAIAVSAQPVLLDPITHPKFQNPLPSPAKINVGATTTTMQMAQTTQWLGLVSPTNAQLQTTVWGYGLNGGSVSYPGPTLVANSNSVANIEWLNNLPATHLMPIDQTYHKANPIAGVPTVVHLHGGHTEAESDGNTEAWYTTNYGEKGPMWTKNLYTYDNTQEGATLWYHDHALGMTRLNVYAGLAGFYLLNDANDQAINLPRNQYDREIVVQDRMFDNTGQFYLPSDPAAPTDPNPSGQPEFFGDFIVVNGVVWPYMNVEPRKYRLRLLNGSDSRVYIFKLSNNASFLQIGTDDGKLNTPVSMTDLTLAPGERAEVIVDFSTMVGQQITLLNTGPDAPYGNPTSPQSDPATTGQIMQFRVNQLLNTAIPDVNITTATNLRPTLGTIQALGAPMKTRKLALFEGSDDLGRILPMLGIVDPTNPNDGSLTWHDPVTENVNLNDTEIWEIYNTTADAHPVHLHLVSFQILSKQTFTGTLTDKMQMMHNGAMGMGSILSNIVLTGTPTNYTPAESGWKDTHILMPGEVMQVKARFDRPGEYVWHCHILSHEDHDMMRKLSVANPCANETVPPVINNCPTNISLTTTSNCANATWTAPTATDNCTTTPSVSFTTSPTVGLTNGGCFPVGTTTVNYMAMDGNNNMATCSFTVTVSNTNPCTNDVTPPVLSSCPTNKSLTTTGTTAIASWTAPTATDNCSTPMVSFTTSPTAGLTNGGAFPIGTTAVNYTAMDAKNNISSCSFNITVTNINACANDITPPVIDGCPANITLVTTGTCATASWTAPYATDNCGTPTITQTAGLSSGSCFPIGVTTVNYTAMDAKNNMATCSFTVTVTQQSTGNDICAAPASNIVVSGNNVLVSGISTSSAIIQIFNSNWTTLFKQQINTSSTTIPIPNAGKYIVKVMVLGTGGKWPVVCNVQQSVTIVANTTQCTNDVTPPLLSACPANISLATTGTSAVASWTAPTATDNCSTPMVSFTTSPTTGLTKGGAFPIGTTTVEYMAMDAKNNMANCSFTVTVTQQSVGNDICTSPISNINASANSIIVSGITTSAASIQVFNSNWASIYNQQVSTNSATIPNLAVGKYTVKVTVLGAGGKWPAVCTVQQAVTITGTVDPCTSDATPPVLSPCPANIALTTTGTTAIASWTAPTATDNCSTPMVSFTTSPTTGLTKGGAFPIGTTTVNYMAMDAKNNMATCSFTVTVSKTNQCATDAVPPVLSPCPANIALTTTGTTAIASWTAPTATDNCSTPMVSFTTSPTAGLTKGGAFPIGTTTVNYMAMDAKNNMATCSFNVSVTQQNTGGDICTSPISNINASANSIIVSGITTSAAIIQVFNSNWASIYNQQVSTNSATIPNLVAGKYTVKVTVLGAGGKWPAVCTVQQAVTITGTVDPCTSDTTPPVLSPCPANISLTTTGTTAIASWTAPTATDNCSTPMVSFTTSPTTGLTKGGAFPIGTTTVNYMAMDAKNNMATCSFTVSVSKTNQCATDAVPPVLSPCPANIALTTTGTTAIASWTAPTATDNCSTPMVSFTTSPTAGLTKGGAFPIGTTTVNYMAMDAKNNMATCSFNVSVSKTNQCATDAVPPVLSPCPANIALTTTGTTAIASWTAPTATDNCSTPMVSFTTSPTAGLTKGGAFPIGTTTVNYMAMDAKNNMANCSFNVSVSKSLACNINFSSTKCYRILSRGSGKVLTVLNNGTSLNTPIVQLTYNTGNNQQIRINTLGAGYFNILFRNSGKALANHSILNNSNCYLYDYSAGGVEDWKIECLANGYYRITHRLSGKVLSITGNSTLDGTKTEIRNLDGTNGQEWKIEEVPCNTTSAYLLDNTVLTMTAAADYKRVKIQWVNNSGERNDYFVVQRLNQASGNYDDIQVVNNASFDTYLQTYLEYDNAPLEGDNLYRVKLVFKDGTIAYTEVKNVVFGHKEAVNIFPNPVESELNIDLNSYMGSPVSVYIYNALGQLTLTKHIDIVTNYIEKIDINNTISGQYMVRLVSKNRKDFTKKITISH